MKFHQLPSAATVLMLILASPLAAQDRKITSVKGPPTFESRAPFHPLAEIPEVEPNGGSTMAQALSCGDALRPAALINAAARDSDWIAFNATVGTLITFATTEDTPGPQTDTVIELIASDGTSSLALNDDDGASSYSRIVGFVAPYTGLYYGRIRGFNGAEGPYRAEIACTAPPPVPDNDTCAGATLISCGSINLSGNTLNAVNDYDLCPGVPECVGSCTGFYSPGRDVVFRLDIGSGCPPILDVTYAISPASVDASLYVVTDCGSVAASCVIGSDSQTGQPTERLVHQFQSAGTYYLILDAFTSAGGSWTLTGELGSVVPVRSTTWGMLKSIYR